ncbi:MAG: hypothetical protein A2474_08690 [Elusimicrobia bacterium RIFOXYC2_FULL_34_12]|nr:MAG: hypothetical protein A2474_08690 [Elusimicrobia bacterium RIFOXYC2_FULL_34_12]OGS39778.1 MAG: hypothetical protein A2551_02560 [Elusimicrobia bacterium RIFOXYD2_FULL_34_30]HAM38420.1 ATP pyrophosphatase [Elusimicrobiota bacterium]
MKIISSWSGGKDSCLACYKAMQQNNEVSCLLNFISRETKRGCFHGIDSKLMMAQSNAIGIPIFQNEVSADMSEYEKEFKSAVLSLKKEDIEGMVFGDIYLLDHANWVDRVCNEIGIKPIEPLWNNNPEDIANGFVDLGFKAIIVSAKADLFDEGFVGREFDKDVVKFLIDRKICPCGENGEFHTFVYDGPIFKKRIKITKTEKIYKSGFWTHWFLDLKEYYLEDKC